MKDLSSVKLTVATLYVRASSAAPTSSAEHAALYSVPGVYSSQL
jgi:hypothetical protein